jgi:hypothetical protein
MTHDLRSFAAADPVVAWRVARLREAGFAPALAERVARDRAYDLHALIELTERGCPPVLAVRILAPIDARL